MQKAERWAAKNVADSHTCSSRQLQRSFLAPPGNTERRFWAKFSPIFRSFSADFPPMVPHPPFFRPHVYRFRLFSAYFPLIFRLKFRPFSAGPVLPGRTIELCIWRGHIRGRLCIQCMAHDGRRAPLDLDFPLH